MNAKTLLSSFLAIVLLAAPGLAQGNLTGAVTFDGKEIPKRAVLDVSSKPDHADHCAKAGDQQSREILVDPKTKGVANVFVEVRKVDKKKWTPEGATFVFDQQFCRFEPHIIVVPVGVATTLKNSDPFSHNVHFYCRKNPSANFAIPADGQKEVSFKFSEKMRVKCDVHPWMDSYIITTDNPYHALTKADGTFSIAGIPAGEYEVRFWHEALGTLKKKKVSVPAEGGTLDAKSGEFKSKR